jgi:hypothetical protein
MNFKRGLYGNDYIIRVVPIHPKRTRHSSKPATTTTLTDYQDGFLIKYFQGEYDISFIFRSQRLSSEILIPTFV